MLEGSWNVNKKELGELLENSTHTAEVEFEDLEEDNFLVLKFTGGKYEVMDETNRFLYFSGEMEE